MNRTSKFFGALLGAALAIGLLSCGAFGQPSPGTSPLSVPKGGTGRSSGTSGGIPYFASTTGNMGSSALLILNQIILGGGAGAAPFSLGSLGTTTTVLHGNASGIPSFAAVVDADITTNTITNAKLAQAGANTVKSNPTSGTANVQDQSMPGCSTATNLNALIYTTNTGFGCAAYVANQAASETATSVSLATTPQGVEQAVIANQGGTFPKNIMARNGGLEIWQRGSGETSNIAVAANTLAYTADGWYVTTGIGAGSTMHVSAQTAVTTTGSRLSGRVQRDSGQTGTQIIRFGFPLDVEEAAATRGRCLVLSFSASTGANWSPTSGTISYVLYLGTGTPVKRNAGGTYTSETTPISSSVNIAASNGGTRTISAITSATPTTTNQAEVQFSWTPTGTASTNDWVQFDDVQLEAVPCGIAAVTPVFENLPYSVLFPMNMRHFAKTFTYNVAPAQSTNNFVGSLYAVSQAATQTSMSWAYPFQMRIVPTITTFSPNAASANCANTSTGAVTVTANPGTSAGDKLSFFNCAAAGAANQNVYLHAQADAGI